MKETYRQMKERHQREINALPLGFAFSEEQYSQKLEEWNITPEEARAGAIVSLAMPGAFIKATDRQKVKDTFNRIRTEEQAARAADKDGTGYLYQMFLYELSNHEYTYTGDINETLDALHISTAELEASPAMRRALKAATEELNGRPDPF